VNIFNAYDGPHKAGAGEVPALEKKERTMKTTKWIIALFALLVFVGCEKSDEQKMQDAADGMQKDAAKAVDGMEVPAMK
jgi:hypothetical protein